MNETNTKRGLLEDGMLMIKEAASFSQLSVPLLYKLMRTHELPYVKIGRSRRIPRRALIELAERHLRGGR
jgi:excisionase family DNA binding protein